MQVATCPGKRPNVSAKCQCCFVSLAARISSGGSGCSVWETRLANASDFVCARAGLGWASEHMAPTPGTTPAGRSVSAACAHDGPGSLSGSNRGQRIKWDHVGSAVSPAFRCQPHTQPRHRHLPRPSPCPGSTLRMNLPWGWPADQGHGPRCLQKDLCRWGRPGEILEGCPPPCTPPASTATASRKLEPKGNETQAHLTEARLPPPSSRLSMSAVRPLGTQQRRCHPSCPQAQQLRLPEPEP